MKQLAQKSRALSLVPYVSDVDSRPEHDPVTLTEPFDGWLNSVDDVLLDANASTDVPNVAFFGRLRLTSTDEVRVDRATIRESKTHRHWPREVVEKFLEAEVITQK
jgi:hypothetical protein